METPHPLMDLPPIVVDPCDACGKLGASMRCGNCKCVYYCDQICQKRDWKAHKPTCRMLVKKIAEAEMIKEKTLNFEKVYNENANESCCICFELVENVNQLQLPCHHIFCTSCLTHHQDHHMKQFRENILFDASLRMTCPLCRAELTSDNLFQYVYANITKMTNQAHTYPKDSAIRNHLVSIARKEYDRLVSLLNTSEIKPTNRYLFDLSLAELLLLEGNFSDAEMLANKLITQEAVKQDKKVYLEALITLIEAQEELHKYDEAYQSLKRLILSINQNELSIYVKETRFMYHHMSVVLYHLQEYERAITAGHAAIEMNRHYDNVYEPLVNCYIALNKWDEAILMQRKAVRYEATWNTDNTKRLEEKLREMIERRQTLTGVEVDAKQSS